MNELLKDIFSGGVQKRQCLPNDLTSLIKRKRTKTDEYEDDQLSLPAKSTSPAPAPAPAPTPGPSPPPAPPISWYDSLTWNPHNEIWSNQYSNNGLKSSEEMLIEFRNSIPNPEVNHLIENTGLDWSNNDWDGIPIETDGLTNSELHDVLFDGKNKTMKGLKQLFDKLQPFSDKGNGDFTPSVIEMEEWFREVIIHFRRLLGIENIPLEGNSQNFLRTRFGDEKKYTDIWDSYGDICPVDPSDDAHCGWNFLPSEADQQPYLQANTPEIPSVNATWSSEGINEVFPMAWSVLPGYVIGKYVLQDGLLAHVRPFTGYSSIGSGSMNITGFGFSMFPMEGIKDPPQNINFKVRNQWFIN